VSVWDYPSVRWGLGRVISLWIIRTLVHRCNKIHIQINGWGVHYLNINVDKRLTMCTLDVKNVDNLGVNTILCKGVAVL
jgi:hypothetical protein